MPTPHGPRLWQTAEINYGTCTATARVSFVVTNGRDKGRVCWLRTIEPGGHLSWHHAEAHLQADGSWRADGKPVRFH